MNDTFKSAADNFSWEPNTHPAIVDPTDLSDPSRYSLLIHEVSLLVGIAPDDLYASSDDSHSLVHKRSNHLPDILPLTLTPTKSLTSRNHRNAGLPHPTNTDTYVRPSDIPNPPPDNFTAPFARRKNVGGVRPSLPLTRRQGQVFHIEPSLGVPPLQNAVDLDETFIHPREPPPKPTSNSPADRCSSLDRLEQSLLKLEAHAPRKHRKSQSEEQAPHYIAHWKNRRPSLPPPRRLKREPSSHEIMPRLPSRPTHAYHFSDCPPLPGPVPLPQNVAPKISSIAPNEDRLPGSFMDMDIPCTKETLEKRQASLCQLPGKEKVKSLVRAAKTASRGVITWGKFFMGTPKSPAAGHETAIIGNSRV